MVQSFGCGIRSGIAEREIDEHLADGMFARLGFDTVTQVTANYLHLDPCDVTSRFKRGA